MGDVAKEGRTVIFVSHNMSAILRLTEETLVIDQGKLILRAPTTEAVDFYLSHGLTQEGQRFWQKEEIPKSSHPFVPIALRIKNKTGKVVDTIRSVDPLTVEVEYELQAVRAGHDPQLE